MAEINTLTMNISIYIDTNKVLLDLKKRQEKKKLSVIVLMLLEPNINHKTVPINIHNSSP
jgi:hypothetical protein